MIKMLKIEEFAHRILKAEAAKKGITMKTLINNFAVELEKKELKSKENECLYMKK